MIESTDEKNLSQMCVVYFFCAVKIVVMIWWESGVVNLFVCAVELSRFGILKGII